MPAPRLTPSEHIELSMRVQADMIGAVHRVCGAAPSHAQIIETLFLTGYCAREIKENLPVVEAHFAGLAVERAAA